MTGHKRSRRELRGALYGTLLGDSWVNSQNQFACEQITLELIAYKRQLLEEYLGRVLSIRTRQRTNMVIEGRKINSKPTFIVNAYDKSFGKFWKVLYKDGRMKVTASMLRRLTPEGLALWLMDDGYFDFKKSNNTRNLRICTDSFTEHEHRLLMDYFHNTWGIQSKVYWHKRSKDSNAVPRLSFNGNNAQKLVAVVYQYVLPCFFYKIDLRYGRMDSVNILPEYRQAVEYMSQHRARLVFGREDIV